MSVLSNKWVAISVYDGRFQSEYIHILLSLLILLAIQLVLTISSTGSVQRRLSVM